jgi:hypothetical protein
MSMREKITAKYEEFEIQLLIDCAFDALMEPTEGMVKAGADADEKLEWAASDAAVPEVFKAMLKAAKEGK